MRAPASFADCLEARTVVADGVRVASAAEVAGLQLLDADAARALTEGIRGDVEALSAKLRQAYRGGVHRALGFAAQL